jgi:hypothetical protein
LHEWPDRSGGIEDRGAGGIGGECRERLKRALPVAIGGECENVEGVGFLAGPS